MREMKDSGVEWIGVIPEGWTIERLQWHVSEIKESNKPEKTRQVLSLTNKRGVIPYEEKGAQGNVAKEDYSQYKLAYPGTIVANSMNILIGSVGRCDYFGCVSPVYYVYKPNEGENLAFIDYIFQMEQFQKELRRYANGILEIRLRVPSDGILKREIAFPTKEAQEKIVHCLNQKCTQIDTLIQNVQTQIEKLKAYKQSLITEVVTKGLDPTVPMKDSGVDWIGEIPEHWQITRLKHLYDTSSGSPVRVGPFGSALPSSELTDEGVWVYNQRTVIDQNFSTNNTFVSPEKASELTSFSVYPKDILITTRGSIGKTAIVPNNAPKGILHPCVIRFRIADDKMDRVLLSLIFNETNICQGQIMDMSNSTTIEVLYSYSLKEIWIPCPPTYEQGEILQQVKKIIQNFARLIAIKQAKIEKLEQYKRSLIYEYVTGKKEVI